MTIPEQCASCGGFKDRGHTCPPDVVAEAPLLTADHVRCIVRGQIVRQGLTNRAYATERGYSEQHLCNFLAGRQSPARKILAGAGLKRVTYYTQADDE